MTKRLRTLFAGLLLFTSLCALAAVEEPTREQQDRNRRYLEKLAHNDPEQFSRLQRMGKTFNALPAARQEQLLKLDRELHESTPSLQSRLQNAAVYYMEWLEALPEADRQKVTKAPDKAARLQIIRELKEVEWLRTQPKALREQIGGLKGPDRTTRIAKLRQEERERRQQWVFAAAFWDELLSRKPMPVRLSDLGQSVESYVNEYLYPLLSKEEKNRLEKVEGRWPDYPVALVEVADRHPPALPGLDGPKYFKDLPPDVRQKLSLKAKKGKEGVPLVLFKAQGAWPRFAQAIVEYVKKPASTLPNEFLAHSYQSLSPQMQDFVEKTLRPRLNEDEKNRLNVAFNLWPEYPNTIQALARAHNLQPPWWTLPGGWDAWKRYRLKSLAE